MLRASLEESAQIPFEMAEGGLEVPETVKVAPKTLPLNSKRLTAVLIRQLARALEIPTTASLEDVRMLIDGKLEEMGHEPMNVQAVLRPGETVTNVALIGSDGQFLEAKPAESEVTPPTDVKTELSLQATTKTRADVSEKS